ncbi:MAG: CARDB domain-containing protein, partial [Candidatus Rokuibacteriota bacterium]
DTGSTTVTIPAGTAAGTWYLFARADAGGAVPELSEGNNIGLAIIQIGSDLVVSSLSAPTATGAGTAIAVTDVTRNQGAGAAAASTTRLYLSADASQDAGDVLLGSRTVPALAAGATSAGATTVTVPAGTAAGAWYVIAKADAGQLVSETIETNNATVAAVMIGPDLAVTAVSAPTAAGAGGAVVVTDTTTNQGGGAAAASTTRVYLSSDAGWDGGDTLLGSRAVPTLAPGAASAGSTSVTIPAGTAGGSYFLVARADGASVVIELNEANNAAARPIQIGPDLVVSALATPATAGAGAAIGVTDTTANQGAGGAGASTTRFYLSTDPVLDGGDVLLGGRTVPGLAGGASSTGSTSVTLPAGLATGTYYVIARADGDGAVAETAEGNNLRTASLQIGPDLVVTALAAPAAAGAGEAVTVTDTTANPGSGAAGASTTRFYLSTNATLDAGDVPLGGRSVPTLASTATSSGTTVLTIPAGTAAGTFHLIARADGDGAVGETDEGNNLRTATIQVGGDLTVTAFSAPGAAGAGEGVTLTDTTANPGSGAVGASTTRFYLSADLT